MKKARVPAAPAPADPARAPPARADDTFRAAMRDVRPLAQTAVRVTPIKAKPARRRPAAEAAHRQDIDAMPLVTANVQGEERLAYRKPGVRDQVARRLRRGLYPIEGDLDLHGLSQAHARMLLADFIASSHAQGRRCVRVIHGKGMRSGERGAVLKSAVNEWLRRHFDVMAFTSARPLDGGAGALYVLLRA